MRLMALAASRSGKRDRTSATAPVTSGAAKLVPCTRQYPPGRAPSRFTAGADSTVAGPVSEPDHSGSAAAPAVPPPPVPPSAGAGPPPPWPATTPAVSPATATTPGSRAGYHTSALPEPDTTLPVHATTTTSCAAAYDSASARTATVTPAPVAYRHAVFAPSAWSCHSPSRTQSACAATGANPTASASPSTNATSAVTAARTAARNVV